MVIQVSQYTTWNWIIQFKLVNCQVQVYLVLLCFALSCLANSAFFSNLRLVVILLQASLSLPFFQQHLHTLSLCVKLWKLLWHFNFFHDTYICYNDPWSVIFDATIVIVLGCHKPRPHKIVNLIVKCVCSECSIHQPFPHLLFLGPPWFLRHNNMEIKPINNLTIASKCSSERRVAHLSL